VRGALLLLPAAVGDRPRRSDGASNALEAWDLLHGNWLLRGWTLTDVSFYPTELPEYAAVELAHGLNAGVLHVAAALTYTLLVVTGGLLARGRARGAEGWARALIAIGVMVAPQLGEGAHVLLGQPDHVGTQVLILGTFLLLERAPRRRYTPWATWALLTVATVADKITIVDAIVPLAFAGLLHAAWARRPAGQRFELSLAIAAGGAVITAGLLLTLISRAGGFTLLPVQTALAAPGGVPGHLPLAWHGILSLFGADVTTAPPGPQAVLACLHAPGFALAVAAFAVAAWHVPSRHDFVADVLAVGIVVNLAGFVASVIPATPFDTREIAALLPFGAVLAGRGFGPRLARARPPRARLARVRRARVRLYRVRPAVVAALAVAGACQLAALGYGAAQPAAPDPEQALAGWLGRPRPDQRPRHLHRGQPHHAGQRRRGAAAHRLLAPARPVRPAACAPSRPASRPGVGALRARRRGAPAVPVVGVLVRPAGPVRELRGQRHGRRDGRPDPRADIRALAGPPARTYQFRSFTIMVWDENLLALLGPAPSRVPGNIGHS